MADERLGLNASDMLSELDKAIAKLKEYNLTVDSVTNKAIEFDAAGKILTATFKSVADNGTQVVTKLGQIDGELKVVSNTVRDSVNNLDRFSKLQIAPTISTEIERSLSTTSALLKATRTDSDKLAKAIQNANVAGRALETPNALNIIRIFAAEGATSFGTLTTEEKKFVDSLIGVQAQLDKVNGKLKQQAEDAKRANIGQAVTQVARTQTIGFGALPTGSQTEITAFNVALEKLRVVAQSSNLPLNEIKRVIADVGSGVAVTQPRFAELVAAFERVRTAASNLGLEKASAQLKNLQLTVGESAARLAQIQFVGPTLPSGATTAEINNLNSALNNLQNTASRSGLSVNDVQRVIADVGNNAVITDKKLQPLVSDILRVQAAAQQLGAESNLAARFKEAASAAEIFGRAVGQIPLGATRGEIANFGNAVSNLANVIAKSGVEQQRVNQILQNVATGRVEVLTGAEAQIQAAAVKTADIHSRAQNRIRLENERTTVAFNQLSATINQLSQRFFALFTNQVFFAFFRRLQSGIKEAQDFSIALGQIRTLAQQDAVSIDQTAESVIKLSNATGLVRSDVAKGLYNALSNQIGSVSESMQFLQEAGRLSIIAVSTLDDASNLLAGTLNSFGLSVTQTSSLVDGFFKTIDLGRIQVKDLANTIGTVGVIANELGVSVQELSGALSTLTIKGITAANAQTFLRNVFVALQKPGKELKDLLNQLGFESGEQAITTLRFSGVLEEIAKAAKNGSKELATLFPNIRALQAAASLTPTKQFNEFTEAIRNSRDEATNAFKIILETPGQRFKILTNEIVNEINKITDSTIKFIADLTDSFGGPRKLINEVKILLTDIAIAIAAIKVGPLAAAIVTAFTSATAAVTRFNAQLAVTNAQVITATGSFTRLASGGFFAIAGNQANGLLNTLNSLRAGVTGFVNSIGGLGTAITIAVAAVGFAINRISARLAEIREEEERAKNSIFETLDAQRNALVRLSGDALNQFQENSRIIAAELGRNLQPIRARFNAVQKDIEDDFQKTSEKLSLGVKSIVDSRQDVINELEKQNQTAKRIIDDLEANVGATQIKFERDLLKQEQQSLSLIEQRGVLLERINLDQLDAIALIEAGEFRQAEKVIRNINREKEEYNKLNEQILDNIKDQVTAQEKAQERIRSLRDKGQEANLNAIKTGLDRLASDAQAVFEGKAAQSQKAFIKNFRDFLRGRDFITQEPFFLERFNNTEDLINSIADRFREFKINGAIDPRFARALDRLDSVSKRKLDIAIQRGDSGFIERFVSNAKAQLDIEDQATKAFLAGQEARAKIQLANQAAANKNFDEQRRLLSEAGELAQQVFVPDLNNLQEATALTKSINESITKSFETQRGEQLAQADLAKRLEDERLAQLDNERKLLEDQQATMKLISDELDRQNKQREDLKAQEEEGLRILKVSLEEAKKIKIDQDITPEGADKALKAFDDLRKAAEATATTKADFAAIRDIFDEQAESLQGEIARQLQLNKVRNDAARLEQEQKDINETRLAVLKDIEKTQLAQVDRSKELVKQQQKLNEEIEKTKRAILNAQVQSTGPFSTGTVETQAERDLKAQLETLNRQKADLAKPTANLKVAQDQILAFRLFLEQSQRSGATFASATQLAFETLGEKAAKNIGIDSVDAFRKFITEVQNSITENLKFTREFGESFNIIKNVFELQKDNLNSFDEAAKKVYDSQRDNLKTLFGIESLEQFKTFITGFVDKIGVDINSRFEDLVSKQTQLFLTAREKVLTESQRQLADLFTIPEAQKNIDIRLLPDIFDSTDRLKNELEIIKGQATELEKGINIEVKVDRSEIDRLIQDIQNLQKTVPVFPQAPTQGFAKGGLVGGRFNSNGQDNILAGLRTGEFVVNPSSTRSFFSELVNINRGIAPSRTINNANSLEFGGINITLEGTGSTETDARNLIKELRKLAHRGVIKFG